MYKGGRLNRISSQHLITERDFELQRSKESILRAIPAFNSLSIAFIATIIILLLFLAPLISKIHGGIQPSLFSVALVLSHPDIF